MDYLKRKVFPSLIAAATAYITSGGNFIAAMAANVSDTVFHPLTFLTRGTCHQLTNAHLLRAGFSNTVMSLGGGWSTIVTTMVYGNYGGGLARSIYSAYRAREEY